MGAAYYLYNHIMGEKRDFVLTSNYLGPGFSNQEISNFLDKSGVVFTQLDNPSKTAAGLIANGSIIGWFQGRLEYGDRALGNRSILGDPRVVDMRDRINLKIKFREGFRPFAPSVLEEKADEWFDLLERSAADRTKRALSGESEIVDRDVILLQDRASAELSAAARRGNPAAINSLPLEFVDETLSFHADWVVDKISPRPLLLITTDGDRLVPPDESEALFALAGEPKKLVTLRGFGHYDVYSEPAFSAVMAETGA